VSALSFFLIALAPFTRAQAHQSSEDDLTFRRAVKTILFISTLVLDWFALREAFAQWFGLSWLGTMLLAAFLSPTPVAPVGAVWAIRKIWGWPWWAVAIIIIVHLEYYAVTYAARNTSEENRSA